MVHIWLNSVCTAPKLSSNCKNKLNEHPMKMLVPKNTMLLPKISCYVDISNKMSMGCNSHQCFYDDWAVV